MLARFAMVRDRLVDVTEPLAERVAPYAAMAYGLYILALPYAVKAFHYGFIPFVLLLGMRNSRPRPSFGDLLTPM